MGFLVHSLQSVFELLMIPLNMLALLSLIKKMMVLFLKLEIPSMFLKMYAFDNMGFTIFSGAFCMVERNIKRKIWLLPFFVGWPHSG